MPVTFGAVGDIISVCLLVKDLVEALDKARGSKVEYQSAIRELWILDRALLEIDLLNRQYGDGSTPELRSLCETAKHAVARCQGLVATFLESVRKYQRTFDEGQKPGLVKEIAMKVRWRIGEKEALDHFRVQIAGTSTSLQMLLVTASVKMMAMNRKEINDKLDRADRRHESTDSAQDAILSSIKDRIEDAKDSIDAGNSILGKVTETLRLNWLRQLGSELKCLMRGAIAMNIATYRAVISLQTSLPSRLERGLIEEPFLLEDPIGRIAPVHLQFVTSWEAFNSILEIRFQSVQGHIKMKERMYGLQDGATGREIEQSRNWQSAFLPGQRVEMSFIFHSDEPANEGLDRVVCPGCQTSSSNSTEADVHCQNCLMWFRRITVVEEEDSLPQSSLLELKPGLDESKPSGQPSTSFTAGKRRFEHDDIKEDEDMREFKRVRLISTKKRVGHQRSVTTEDVTRNPSPLTLTPPPPTTSKSGMVDKLDLDFDNTGQIAPPGLAPRVHASLWEDEGTLCFEVESKSVRVARREDNHMINATKLLNVAGMNRGRRDGILRAERTRHVVKLGPTNLKGVWIPFERALEFANKERITEQLYPLFVYDIGALLYHPANRTGGKASAIGKLETGLGADNLDQTQEGNS
ncbi:apses-domain-containing protein [Cucurbitaria berberidis CBS 394.84]|uniref:Apses-domain-containing protein n=1 Tax=Cucurbitaria berberidis CBS 394.84 TaxID=1168544 RepID=A0A9P4GQL2_9PLEO|nr:apses-domain-containing protein [Cucurbitaria berberidis CBS 394.84]KAF1849519.1 apses-domain-containing protein [Cucurbitaria berberidis CBS 394.84]